MIKVISVLQVVLALNATDYALTMVSPPPETNKPIETILAASKYGYIDTYFTNKKIPLSFLLYYCITL